jgi:hypothetical protein
LYLPVTLQVYQMRQEKSSHEMSRLADHQQKA